MLTCACHVMMCMTGDDASILQDLHDCMITITLLHRSNIAVLNLSLNLHRVAVVQKARLKKPLVVEMLVPNSLLH